MLPLVVFSMVGLMAAAVLSDGSSDDGDDVLIEDETEDPPVLTREGDIISATEGNDRLETSDFEEIEDAASANTVNLLGGDDLFEHLGELNGEAIVNGGEGNDSISSTGEFEDTLNGDAGNDTLTSSISTSSDGGVGDDILKYDHGDGLGDHGTAIIEGGEGDDTIYVSETFGTDNLFDNSGAVVRGGNGADTILFELRDGVTPEAAALNVGYEGEDTSLIMIADFEPQEDSLVVDITSFAAQGNLEFFDAELAENEEGTYELALSFMAEGATAPFTATLNIESESALGLQFITIVNNNTDSLGFEDRVLSFTAGNDSITDEVLTPTTETVEAGAGDDVIGIDRNLPFVDAGNGDDAVVLGANSDGNGTAADGGEGDDTISGFNMIDGYLGGGAGDDVISLTQNALTSDDGAAFLDGGDGNDTINLDIGVAQHQILDDGTTVSNYGDRDFIAIGGTGMDEFNVILNALTLTEGEMTPFEGTKPILEIPFFDPVEDQLIIDLANSPGLADVQSVETRIGENGFDTELLVTFLNADGVPGDAVINLGRQAAEFDLQASVTVLLPTA